MTDHLIAVCYPVLLSHCGCAATIHSDQHAVKESMRNIPLQLMLISAIFLCLMAAEASNQQGVCLSKRTAPLAFLTESSKNRLCASNNPYPLLLQVKQVFIGMGRQDKPT